MLRLAIDADVSGKITKGLRRHFAEIDIARTQEVGLRTAADPHILEWAASEGRVLVSGDRRTMIRAATDRISHGQPMPGLIIVPNDTSIGIAIEQVAIFAICSTSEELNNLIKYIPLR